MFGHNPNKHTSPLEKADYPELELCEELYQSGIKLYQSMIGSVKF
jgi:hypothetical protein